MKRVSARHLGAWRGHSRYTQPAGNGRAGECAVVVLVGIIDTGLREYQSPIDQWPTMT